MVNADSSRILFLFFQAQFHLRVTHCSLCHTHICAWITSFTPHLVTLPLNSDKYHRNHAKHRTLAFNLCFSSKTKCTKYKRLHDYYLLRFGKFSGDCLIISTYSLTTISNCKTLQVTMGNTANVEHIDTHQPDKSYVHTSF